MLQAKTPHKDIIKVANCHISQVKQMTRNIKKFGSIKASKLKKQDYSYFITQEIIEIYQYSLSFEYLININL